MRIRHGDLALFDHFKEVGFCLRKVLRTDGQIIVGDNEARHNEGLLSHPQLGLQ